MELCQPLFCKAPKAFKAINIHFPCCEPFPMIYSQMTIATEHQGIITSEFIGVNDGASADHFHSLVQQTVGGNIAHHRYCHSTVSLEDTEDRYLACSSSTTSSFTSSAEVRFIDLDFSRKPEIVVRSRQGHPYDLASFVGCRVAQSGLLCNLTSRYFQFKELNDPQPSSIRKVMKAITTSFAAVSAITNSIYFIATTIAAKNMAVFPANFLEIFSSSTLAFPYRFEGY